MQIISKEKFGAQIANKFVLFDTNVILRACYNFNAFESFFKFLRQYFENLHAPSIEIIQDAISIANAYSARKISASLIDCCIVSYLKKYFKNLFLATLNYKHFPTFLLDAIFVYPIDTKKEIFPLSFYQFNNSKAEKILKF